MEKFFTKCRKKRKKTRKKKKQRKKNENFKKGEEVEGRFGFKLVRGLGPPSALPGSDTFVFVILLFCFFFVFFGFELREQNSSAASSPVVTSNCDYAMYNAKKPTKTRHGPRLYVCQAPNAGKMCVKPLPLPNTKCVYMCFTKCVLYMCHQMRLCVFHQMRLYVCHQMRLYVCRQMHCH